MIRYGIDKSSGQRQDALTDWRYVHLSDIKKNGIHEQLSDIMDKYEDMKYLFILLQGYIVDNSSENDIYVRVTEIILRMIRDIEGKLQTLQECIEQ